MSNFPEYDSYDGLGLAELVRNKEVSPFELVEAAIERVEKLNPQINAVVHEMYDYARDLAKQDLPDGPFKGVPFMLKDLQAKLKGFPVSRGSRFYKDDVPDHNSEHVNRFLKSGVIIVGKTNTPEFGLDMTTEPKLFGPTRNPWDTKRSSGGSSGGTAAAVAARMVPLGNGGDGGGSIRIPSSCCGVFGMKPSRGRIPVGPDAPEGWQGFSIEHVLTRSVRDSAAMLDATAGPDLGAFHQAPAPDRPFLEEVGQNPGKLKIAFSTEPLLLSNKTISSEVSSAFDETVKLLESLGHDMAEAAPEIDGYAFASAFFTVVAAETWASLHLDEKRMGRKAGSKDLETRTWTTARIARNFHSGEFAVASRYLKQVGRTVASFMEEQKADVILSPTLAKTPIPLGHFAIPKVAETSAKIMIGHLSLGGFLRKTGLLEKTYEQLYSFSPYTPVYNATGQPSMSIPLAWSQDGLPIGMMFTGRYGDEATLFRLASQLEEALPWKDRKPPVCSD